MPKTLTENRWTREYRKRGTLFLHDGKSSEIPHALLTSGKHSSGYFDSPPLLKSKRLLARMVSDLVDVYLQAGGNIEIIDRVVGPRTGRAILARGIAKEISLRRRRACNFASLRKDESGDFRNMVFDDCDREIVPNESMLVCDDVVTTGGSINLTVDAIKRTRGQALYLVCALVNRSGQSYFRSYELVGLVSVDMPVWTPEECPLCKIGSRAVRLRDLTCSV